jgi:hypothetical protein
MTNKLTDEQIKAAELKKAEKKHKNQRASFGLQNA